MSSHPSKAGRIPTVETAARRLHAGFERRAVKSQKPRYLHYTKPTPWDELPPDSKAEFMETADAIVSALELSFFNLDQVETTLCVLVAQCKPGAMATDEACRRAAKILVKDALTPGEV